MEHLDPVLADGLPEEAVDMITLLLLLGLEVLVVVAMVVKMQ
jgi:hypothetical protein